MLTTKRERFVQHYVACGSASEAARLAGYSTNSAKQEGHRLLTFADVRSAIDIERARLRAKADLRTEDVVNGLLEIARDKDAPHSARVAAWRNLGLHLGIFEHNAVADSTVAFLKFLAGEQPAITRSVEVLDS